MKLNLGCGADRKPGWINIDGDRTTAADMFHDLSKGLPFGNDTADFIYAEHFLEHLSRADGVRFLAECRRVLKPGGVIRISMPDLREFVRLYQAASRGNPEALKIWESAGWIPKTPAQMMNEEFRNWGHQFIYDWSETRSVFLEAGFNDESIKLERWGESEYSELCNLETRPDHWNDIQAEAEK